jgi:hypothetical protein
LLFYLSMDSERSGIANELTLLIGFCFVVTSLLSLLC